jgi:hypothetical protein
MTTMAQTRRTGPVVPLGPCQLMFGEQRQVSLMFAEVWQYLTPCYWQAPRAFVDSTQLTAQVWSCACICVRVCVCILPSIIFICDPCSLPSIIFICDPSSLPSIIFICDPSSICDPSLCPATAVVVPTLLSFQPERPRLRLLSAVHPCW